MFGINILNRNNTKNPQNSDKEEIIKYVQNDLKAVDLKMSLYIACCSSIPLSEIHPTPPGISSEFNKFDEPSILSMNDCIPPIDCLLSVLKHPTGIIMSSRAYDILKWLVVNLKEPKISYLAPESYEDILKLVPNRNEEFDIQSIPEAIFSVTTREMSTLSQNWYNTVDVDVTNYAFIPCNVETLHCLIYKGLVSKDLNSDGSISLFTDLNYSISLAPLTWTWGKSAIGTNLKAVAIVEYVDNESTVEEIKKQGEISHYKLLNPMYGRIKYLLVYPQEKRLPLLANRKERNKRNYLRGTLIISWSAIMLACIINAAKTKPWSYVN